VGAADEWVSLASLEERIALVTGMIDALGGSAAA